MYELKHTSRQWLIIFFIVFLNSNFKQSKSNFPFSNKVVQLKLQQLFKLKIIGNLKYFLGLELAYSTK
ncbi:hypothetical protein CR513_40745, partial [Mucuna pruriens]